MIDDDDWKLMIESEDWEILWLLIMMIIMSDDGDDNDDNDDDNDDDQFQWRGVKHRYPIKGCRLLNKRSYYIWTSSSVGPKTMKPLLLFYFP